MRTTARSHCLRYFCFGLLVTVPNASQGWTNSGSQTYVFSDFFLVWTLADELHTLLCPCSAFMAKVSTDRDNFTIVLTNQASTIT